MKTLFIEVKSKKKEQIILKIDDIGLIVEDQKEVRIYMLRGPLPYIDVEDSIGALKNKLNCEYTYNKVVI